MTPIAPPKEYLGTEIAEASRQIEDPLAWPITKTVITRTVPREPYRPAKDLRDAVNIALTLRRPLLLQGDPGCGKTRLAYAVAYELGLPLEECYIKSTSRAQDLLYSYDAVSRLYDSQLGQDGPKDEHSEPLCRSAKHYIHYGPLGRAIIRAGCDRSSVVLIDEIDKADLDFPNDLLLELDRMEFTVAELPNTRFTVSNPAARPLIIVTHNEEKALPNAFLRRCIYHFVEFPLTKTLGEILGLHDVPDSELRDTAIDMVEQLRGRELKKRPGLSELIDWVRYLQQKGSTASEARELLGLDILLKQHADQLSVRKETPNGHDA